MARPLLVPTAFVTLLGLAPPQLAFADPPAGVPAAPPPAAAPEAATAAKTAPSVPDPSALVVVSTSRSGNARAPSYDDGMLQTRNVAGHPLVEAVLARVVEDEGPHAQLGWLFLEWAPLTDADRRVLGRIATEELDATRHLREAPTSAVQDGITTEGFRLADVHTLGWLDTEAYVPIADAAARQISSRLDRLGIPTRRGAPPPPEAPPRDPPSSG